MGYVLGRKPEHERNLVFFRVKYLVCAAGAAGAGVVSVAIGSFYVFCNEWLCLCA